MGRAVGTLMGESYSRLYHRFPEEFQAIYEDDRTLATWVRLLLQADASWPLRPPLPRSVKARPLAVLVDAGLVSVSGDTYRIRGLDAERNRRSDAGRIGAVKRWQSDGNANASATAMPRRDETSKGETREIPPPPAERGRRADETNPRALGSNPRANGTSPRAEGTSTRQRRIGEKTGPTQLGSVLRQSMNQLQCLT